MTDLSFAVRAVNEAKTALDQVARDLDSVGDAANTSGSHLSSMGGHLRDAGDAAQKSGGFFASLKGTLGDVSKIAGGFIVGAGLMDLPGKLMDITGSASDLNESMAKAQTIFGPAFGDIDQFASDAAEALGLSRQAALAATGEFGNMFTQLGIGKGTAADMSEQMVSLAADFASFNNADITEVIQAQEAAFRGEYDSLQRFVPTINAAAVQTEALTETGKKNVAQLTDQDKAIATQTLILRGAGDALGDFARTKDEDANRTRILKAEYANMSAELGQKLLPAQIAIKGAMLDAIPVIRAVGTALAPLATMAFDGLKTLGTMAFDGLKTLAAASWSAMQSAWSAIGPTVTSVAALAWDGLKDVASASWSGLQTAWESVGPILGRVAGLAWSGLTALGSLAFDGLKSLAGVSWTAIKDAWAVVGPALEKAAGYTFAALSDLAGLAWSGMQKAWEAIEPLLKKASGYTWGALSDVASLGWDAMKGAWEAMVKAVDDVNPKLREAAQSTKDGADDTSAWSKAMDGLGEAIRPVLKVIKDLASDDLKEAVKGGREIAGSFAELGSALSGIGGDMERFKGLIKDVGKMLASELGIVAVGPFIAALALLKGAIGPLSGAFAQMISDIATVIRVIDGIGSAVANVPGQISSAKDGIVEAWNGITSAFTSTDIAEPLRGVGATVSGLVPGMSAAAVGISQHWGEIVAKFDEVWEQLKKWFRESWDTLKDKFLDPFIQANKDIAEKGADFVKGLGSGISGALGGLWAIVNDGLIGPLKGAFDGALGWLESAGKALVQGLINGVTAMWQPLVDTFNKVTSLASKIIPHNSPAPMGIEQGEALLEGIGLGTILASQSAAQMAAEAAHTVSQASLDQLNRDLAAWEADFLATTAKNARIELGGAFNVGQMFGSSPTEGHYNPALFGGFGGGIPYLQGGGSVAAPLPAYSGPTNNAGTTGRWGGFNNGITIQINAPVFGVDDLMKTLDSGLKRAGYDGILIRN